MPRSLPITEFLDAAKTAPIVDVRTPAEFMQGHIPGAVNIPLFSDEERVIIGTLYKQRGKQPAIEKGLELVGPKLHLFIAEAKKLQSETLLLHCWRGGMRSGSMAWLFEMYGFSCITLRGGYKQFRRHVLGSFSEKRKILILGGKTGSGKTIILHELEKLGEQVVDLEKLAHHKGSSFGSLGEEKQLRQEHFENVLWYEFSKTDPAKYLWLENESRRIGVNALPEGLWQQMTEAYTITINLPDEERTNYLVREYGKYSSDDLIAAMERITKQLGGQHAKAAVEAIRAGDLATACRISLVYYDKTYTYGTQQRPAEKVIAVKFDTLDPPVIAAALAKKRQERYD